MYQGLAYDLQQTVKIVAEDGLYSSTVTFLRRTNDPADPAVSAMGQADIANFTAVPGLQNLQCMYAPQSTYRPNMSGVVRTEERFETVRERHLLLNGYFSPLTILQRYVADVAFGGETLRHEVMSVEPDSQTNVTRVALRYITF